jgi:hypothetical protein
MRRISIRVVCLIGILFVLLAALLACLRWYPYPFDFSSYPTLSHTKSGATGDPINVLFVGGKTRFCKAFTELVG